MSKHIKIGVFIPNDAQFLDVACVDSLGVMSKEYLGLLPDFPEHVVSIAPSVSVYYITSPENGSTIPLTSGATLKSTHIHTDDDVAPGKLDIVVVPGPDPTSEYAEAGLEWLRKQAATPGVDIICICTGIFVCASAGIVDGKKASGPRGLQAMIKKKFPEVDLVGDRYRWVQDGNFWSSGTCLAVNTSYLAWEYALTKLHCRRRHEWKRARRCICACFKALATAGS